MLSPFDNPYGYKLDILIKRYHTPKDLPAAGRLAGKTGNIRAGTFFSSSGNFIDKQYRPLYIENQVQ
jgi:hypothetical protein